MLIKYRMKIHNIIHNLHEQIDNYWDNTNLKNK